MAKPTHVIRTYPVTLEALASWLITNIEWTDVQTHREFVVAYHTGDGKMEYIWHDEGTLPPYGHIFLSHLEVERSPERITLKIRGKHHVWRGGRENPDEPRLLEYPLFVFDLVAYGKDKTQTQVYSRTSGHPDWPTMRAYEAEVLARIEQYVASADGTDTVPGHSMSAQASMNPEPSNSTKSDSEARPSAKVADAPWRRAKPKEPPEGADLSRWFDWYHECKKNGFKASLKDIAERVGLSYNHVRRKHSAYLEARKQRSG